MPTATFSPRNLLIATILLSQSLSVTRLAHAHGALAASASGYCDLSLTAMTAKANGASLVNNGTIKQGASLAVSCTAGLGGASQMSPCNVTLSLNGQQAYSIPGAQLQPHSTRSFVFTAVNVTQAVGSTLVVSCEVNPYSSYIGGDGHATPEKNYGNNKMSMTFTVVQ